MSGKNEFHKVYYHKLGTPQSEDELIYQNRNYPLRNYRARVTDDERFLIIYESETTSGEAVYVKDLSKKNAEFIQIVDNFEKDYSVLDNIGNELLVLTNYDAPRKQLVLINPDKPKPENWKTVISEKDEVLGSASLVGGRIVQYMKDATSRAHIYTIMREII